MEKERGVYRAGAIESCGIKRARAIGSGGIESRGIGSRGIGSEGYRERGRGFRYARGVMPERCLKKLVRALWSLKLRWVAISPMVMSE